MHEPYLVILAGGISSRMKKIGAERLDGRLAKDAESRSKSMIRLGAGDRPFLDYLLFNAYEAGYRDLVIVVGEHDYSIRRRYGEKDQGNTYGGLTISYAVQPIPAGRKKPMGTADALLHGLRLRPDWRGTSVTVCNSDNLYSQGALRAMLEVPSGCAMADYDRDALKLPADRVGQFAVIMKDARGNLVDIVEKPSPEEVQRARNPDGRVGVSMNLWRFPVDWIIPCLEETPVHQTRLEKELPTAVALLVQRHPGCLLTLPLAEHVPDLTSREDIAVVQAHIARAYPDFSFGPSRR